MLCNILIKIITRKLYHLLNFNALFFNIIIYYYLWIYFKRVQWTQNDTLFYAMEIGVLCVFFAVNLVPPLLPRSSPWLPLSLSLAVVIVQSSGFLMIVIYYKPPNLVSHITTFKQSNPMTVRVRRCSIIGKRIFLKWCCYWNNII
jgi:hypothetical protein